MLTEEAFNALLKTLEEPPSHVVFIFATTRPTKSSPTILSRCQRFDFKRLTVDGISGKLKDIAKSEKSRYRRRRFIRSPRGGRLDARRGIDA